MYVVAISSWQNQPSNVSTKSNTAILSYQCRNRVNSVLTVIWFYSHYMEVGLYDFSIYEIACAYSTPNDLIEMKPRGILQ